MLSILNFKVHFVQKCYLNYGCSMSLSLASDVFWLHLQQDCLAIISKAFSVHLGVLDVSVHPEQEHPKRIETVHN